MFIYESFIFTHYEWAEGFMFITFCWNNFLLLIEWLVITSCLWRLPESVLFQPSLQILEKGATHPEKEWFPDSRSPDKEKHCFNVSQTVYQDTVYVLFTSSCRQETVTAKAFVARPVLKSNYHTDTSRDTETRQELNMHWPDLVPHTNVSKPHNICLKAENGHFGHSVKAFGFAHIYIYRIEWASFRGMLHISSKDFWQKLFAAF